VLPYSRGFGGCCLLPRVRRVLAGTEGLPGVGYYREFGGCCLTLEGLAGVAYYRGCAGCWLAPRVRRVLATTMWRTPGVGYYHVEEASVEGARVARSTH
jgi:hypothetical protein